jgi:peptidoglycan/LPS O-acetylase OafA/YrhL
MTILDGSRGVAALVVMLTHSLWTIDLVPTGAFAVDYFFVLSGLVMGYAYESKLKTGAMSLPEFFNVRFIRLYPMIALGMVLAAGVYLANRALFEPTLHVVSIAEVLIAGLLLIPLPPGFLAPDILWIYPTNLPVWSIFYEVLSNILFAPLARFVTLPRLIGLACVIGLLLANALWYRRPNSFGILLPDFPEGLARTIYSFIAGLIIFKVLRPGRHISTALLPILLAVFLAICNVHAYWSSNTLRFWWIISTLFLMPGLVWLMAHMRPGPRLERACSYLGRLSYPLYLVHFPILSFFNRLIAHFNFSGPKLYVMVALQLGAAIAAAVAAVHLVDEPVRARLSGWAKRNPKLAADTAVQ